VETKDDSLQPTIDLLLNVVIFLWIGAVCPWHSFVYNSVIPIYRLVPLGIMVLLFRRPPIVLLLRTQIPQIENIRHASFVGYFGPMGVSAIFYLCLTIDWLEVNVQEQGHASETAEKLTEILTVVVWFVVICSVVSKC
jgi:sodium/hydrogen antiporter